MEASCSVASCVRQLIREAEIGRGFEQGIYCRYESWHSCGRSWVGKSLWRGGEGSGSHLFQLLQWGCRRGPWQVAEFSGFSAKCLEVTWCCCCLTGQADGWKVSWRWRRKEQWQSGPTSTSALSLITFDQHNLQSIVAALLLTQKSHASFWLTLTYNHGASLVTQW